MGKEKARFCICDGAGQVFSRLIFRMEGVLLNNNNKKDSSRAGKRMINRCDVRRCGINYRHKKADENNSYRLLIVIVKGKL